MKPSQLVAALECSIDQKLPFFIWGAAGIGKSDLIKLVAETRDLSLCDLRVALFDPVDLRGLPRAEEDKTVWLPPALLPRDGKGILFLDELTTAPQMIQAACYQLVLDRKLGEYTLPDGWVVIAAWQSSERTGCPFFYAAAAAQSLRAPHPRA
jgi:MoxR-like ATPase